MKNNPVFQVLVVSDCTLLTSGGVTDLSVGQLGVFDAETNQAVDAADDGHFPKKFFLAVGLPNANGNLGDIRKSAGEFIDRALVNKATLQAPVAGLDQMLVLDLTSFTPEASKEYVIRLSFMSQGTMMIQGFNHPVKSFVVATGATAPNLSDFIDLFVDEVNRDDEGIVTASNSAGTALLLTIGAEDKVDTVAGLNPKYHFLRQFKCTLSAGGDFTVDDGHAIVDLGLAYQEGSGYDVQQMEYTAGGWIGNPGVIRESQLTGLIGKGTKVFAIAGTNYYLLRLNYEFTSHSGGNLPYSNQLETVVAVAESCVENEVLDDLIEVVNIDFNTEFETPTTTTTSTTQGI